MIEGCRDVVQLWRRTIEEAHRDCAETSDTVLDIHRDAIDIAIRYGRLRDSTLFARKLNECPGVLVAAPS